LKYRPPHGHFFFLVLPLQNLFVHEISWRHAALHCTSLTIFVENLVNSQIANLKFIVERGWTVFETPSAPRTFLFFYFFIGRNYLVTKFRGCTRPIILHLYLFFVEFSVSIWVADLKSKIEEHGVVSALYFR